MADDFPQHVQKFILDVLGSVEELEVLLMLRSAPEKNWSAAEVGRGLYTSPAAAAMRLAHLHEHGMVALIEGPERLYCFRPARSELVQIVDQLADLYKERRVSVINLIYSKPHDKVQALADAFKFRQGQ